VNESRNHHTELTDVTDSVLIVIDLQRHFLDKLDNEIVEPLLNRIGWIVEVAVKLGVPVIVTAEDISEVGTTVSEVANAFPDGTVQHDKTIFGLGGDRDVLAAVQDLGRNSVVLVGLETDVCVMQSALGLLQHGFRVVALSDATASPGPCHDAGLSRMRDAGVIISTVKGTFYEWVRGLKFTDEHLGGSPLIGDAPDGVRL